MLALLAAAGCGSSSTARPAAQAPAAAPKSGAAAAPLPAENQRVAAAKAGRLPGMPAPLSATDVWAADRPGAMSPVVKGFRPLVYVPNSGSNTVTEIDPRTYRVVRTLKVGRQPQHVVPSWDLRTLWVNNDRGNTLTAIDPRTGRPGRTVGVHDPYNLYFTPDGKFGSITFR